MIADGAIAYLGANCFIVALEGSDETAAQLREFLAAASEGQRRIATSDMTEDRGIATPQDGPALIRANSAGIAAVMSAIARG